MLEKPGDRHNRNGALAVRQTIEGVQGDRGIG